MVIARFLIQYKTGKIRFFEKTFLLADTRIKRVLRKPFWLSVIQTFSFILKVLPGDPTVQSRPYLH